MMDDKKFDEMFKRNLEFSKIQVDVDEMWSQVRPEKEKRRRHILWWSLAATFAFVFIAFWIMNSKILSDELTRHPKVNLIDVDITKKGNQLVTNGEILCDNDILSSKSFVENMLSTHKTTGIEKGRGNTSIDLQGKNGKLHQSNYSLRKNNSEIGAKYLENTLDEVETINQLNPSVDLENWKIEDLDTLLYDKSKKNMSSFDSYLNHGALLKIQRDNQPLIIPSWNSAIIRYLPNDFEKEDINRNSFGIEIYSGYANLNRILDVEDSIHNTFLGNREATEMKRFSVVSGMDFCYRIHNWGLSMGLMYQKHYTYFQDSLSINAFTLKNYKSTFFKKQRTIKSNVITTQISANIMIRYSLNWKRWLLQPAIGIKYNFQTNGKGKFYTSINNISNVKDKDYYQSEGWTPIARLCIQYQIYEKCNLNIGVLHKLSSNSILKNESFIEKYRNTYITVGFGIHI